MHYAPPVEKHPEQRVFTMATYVISSFGAVVQYAETLGLVLAGCALLMISGFMVKAQRLTAKDTIYASHVEWTARTISIGSRFLFPLSIAIALYLVYDMTDIASLKKSLADSDGNSLGAVSNIVKTYIADNERKISRITTLSITPPIFWWVRRCWFGLVRADKHEPIDFPDSFF